MKSNKIYVSQKRYNDNLIITVRNPTDTQDLQDNSFTFFENKHITVWSKKPVKLSDYSIVGILEETTE